MEMIPDSQRTKFFESLQFVLSECESGGRGDQTVARMIEFLGTPFFFSYPNPALDLLGRMDLDGRGEHA